MNTWANNLFYLVFLGQILLASWFVPRLILHRLDKLFATCPPATHPKLYPKPIAYYRVGRDAFKWANLLILLLGFAMLYGAHALDGGTFTDDGYISEAWPAAYGVIQFVPLMALELFGFRQLHWMRAANTNSMRKAELRPRRLFEYVSPGLLALAIASFVAVIAFDLHVTGYTLDWSRDPMQRDVTLVGTNVFLVALGLWYLFGRKRDPHQATDDRARQVKAQLASLLLVSTLMSVYFITRTADDAFDLDFLDAPLMSLYFQVIVAASIGFTLRRLKFEDIDFSVYANDTPRENHNG